MWRTQEDDKVRSSHANGKIFSYNEPHSTGHPGQAYNCRCYGEEINATFNGIENFVSKYDINTWPSVPINDTLKVWPPSRVKNKLKGEKSLYDIYGGEWRPHVIDKRHNLHWNYKPAGKFTKWLNIPINGKVPKIIEKHKYKFSRYKKSNMLQVRYFDDFSGSPQILISGTHQDYSHTAKYLFNKQSALLNDKNCFLYYPPLIPFLDEWLVINQQECKELSELFQRIGSDPGYGYHYYYDLESQKNVDFDIKISIGEYDREFFEE